MAGKWFIGCTIWRNRKRSLMATQRKISRKKNRAMVGQELSVLVWKGFRLDTDLLWNARLSTQAPEIDGVVMINDFEGAEPAPGQMRVLRITEAHDYDLIGTLLPPTEADVALQPVPAGLINISMVMPNQIPVR